MQTTVLRPSDLDRGVIRFGLIQQVPCALVCLLRLDGGRMARICGVTMLGFWAAAAILIARWPDSPRPGDITLLRRGFLPLLAIAAVLASVGRFPL